LTSRKGCDVEPEIAGRQSERDAVARQQRPHLLIGEHSPDTGHPAGFFGIDIQDQGMTVRAAHEGDMEDVWNPNVVDKLPFAAQKRPVFKPVEALRLVPYRVGGHCSSLRGSDRPNQPPPVTCKVSPLT
jgi:hypothetical protein